MALAMRSRRKSRGWCSAATCLPVAGLSRGKLGTRRRQPTPHQQSRERAPSVLELSDVRTRETIQQIEWGDEGSNPGIVRMRCPQRQPIWLPRKPNWRMRERRRAGKTASRPFTSKVANARRARSKATWRLSGEAQWDASRVFDGWLEYSRSRRSEPCFGLQHGRHRSPCKVKCPATASTSAHA